MNTRASHDKFGTRSKSDYSYSSPFPTGDRESATPRALTAVYPCPSLHSPGNPKLPRTPESQSRGQGAVTSDYRVSLLVPRQLNNFHLKTQKFLGKLQYGRLELPSFLANGPMGSPECR